MDRHHAFPKAQKACQTRDLPLSPTPSRHGGPQGNPMDEITSTLTTLIFVTVRDKKTARYCPNLPNVRF
jgi:hypothetical protein